MSACVATLASTPGGCVRRHTFNVPRPDPLAPLHICLQVSARSNSATALMTDSISVTPQSVAAGESEALLEPRTQRE
jgi:hypothetical protein